MKTGDAMLQRVAVLGGGNIGQTEAADFALGGCEVRLFDFPEFAPRSLAEVLQTKKIELSGGQSNLKDFKRTGIAELAMVTTDIGKAMKGAGFVVVAIPAMGHPRMFEQMIPHLEDGQIVNIFPDNFGSLMLRDMLRKSGRTVDIVVGAWHSAPYGTRLSSPGHVHLAIREANQIYDTLPSCDADQFIEEVRDLPIFGGVSEFIRAETVIGVGFANANPLVHVPGSILNVGAMEVSQVEDILAPKGQWNLYKHGMSPAVSRVQIAFYREEQALMAALGLKMIPEYTERQFYSKYSVMAMEYFIPFGVATLMGNIFGPNSVEDRYFTEDIPIGTVARYNLATALGVDVPIIKAMIDLGSLICQRDFLAEGMTLAKMGIEGLDREQLARYLREGKK
ncbi:MAG: NAD/NADP octopine/nopaline dehydrogenase family protein [Chloroflexi bacterium]|nr:NAD/NADP octopine/nopaline dehydrogenase family protein [Chloroflexota bacterium]